MALELGSAWVNFFAGTGEMGFPPLSTPQAGFAPHTEKGVPGQQSSLPAQSASLLVAKKKVMRGSVMSSQAWVSPGK